MRKRKSKIGLMLILVFISICSFSQEKSRLYVSVDERIETLYTIALYSDYFLINNHNNINKMELLKDNFKDLRKHKAVILFDSLSRKYDFSYYRIIDWALVHSPMPEFRIINSLPIKSPFVTAGHEHLLEEFEEQFRYFAQDSLFVSYLKNVSDNNSAIIKQVSDSETLMQIPMFLENFYGKKLSSYNLILSPLVHSGGFNSEVIDTKGKRMVYACVGPNGEIDFKPYFEREFIEMDLLLHEFGHSFVNPLMEQYRDRIQALKSLYYTKEFEMAAKKQGYSEWKYAFNEALVRATTILITEKQFGMEKAKDLLTYEKGIGFSLTESIVKIVSENYIPSKYKSFDIFYPQLLCRLAKGN